MRGSYRKPTCRRTVSPSTHPRPASVRLRISSRLAPSFYPLTSRSPGSEDARYVRPISATQSNCVYPHLARSRLLAPLAWRGHPSESWAPSDETGGPDVFTTSEDRFGGSSCGTIPSIEDASAWACSSHVAGCDRASDTPVATFIRLRASPAFAGAATWPYVPP